MAPRAKRTSARVFDDGLRLTYECSAMQRPSANPRFGRMWLWDQRRAVLAQRQRRLADRRGILCVRTGAGKPGAQLGEWRLIAERVNKKLRYVVIEEAKSKASSATLHRAKANLYVLAFAGSDSPGEASTSSSSRRGTMNSGSMTKAPIWRLAPIRSHACEG